MGDTTDCSMIPLYHILSLFVWSRIMTIIVLTGPPGVMKTTAVRAAAEMGMII